MMSSEEDANDFDQSLVIKIVFTATAFTFLAGLIALAAGW